MTHGIPPIGEVDVWMARTDHLSDSDRRICETVLSDEERARLGKFVVEHARTQFLAARCLLRMTLSRYVAKEPGAWAFTFNPYGRPRLSDGQVATPLHFNLSHTAGLVVCAISRTEEVGVDVERLDRELPYMTLAQTVFADTELAKLTSARSMERREIFFNHWTLKEAYIKARGMGLSLPLKAIWFEVSNGSPEVFFSPEVADDPSRWNFRQFSPTENHRMALAVSFAPYQVSLRVNLRTVSVCGLPAISDDARSSWSVD